MIFDVGHILNHKENLLGGFKKAIWRSFLDKNRSIKPGFR